MSFMVNFRSAEGKQGYHPADSLEEAVRFVEHLRNQEHVVDARVWRLQEVPLEVKTYYKVEVAPQGSEPAATRPAGPRPANPQADDDSGPERVSVAVGADVPPAPAVPGGPAASAAAASAGASGGPDGPAGPNGPGGPNGARFGRFNRT